MHELRRGHLIPVPDPETAQRFLRSVGEDPDDTTMRGRRAVIGDPAQVCAGLEAVVAEYQADELVVVTITHDHAARLHSYELIAEAFELST